MNTPFPREGILAALAIPSDARGRVLKKPLAAHLSWLREQGVHGVLALGSSGEFPRFSVDARKAALETIAELAAPLPVIANISDVRSQVVAELGRFARSLGLPGVGIMPPSFYPLSPADQLAFFLHAAEATQLPVMLYNFPELTGNRIAAETIAAFADRAPMAAIKQSGREFEYHRQLIEIGAEKDFSVFSGADTRLPEVFALGAHGCIGGLVNFVPEYMLSIHEHCRLGRAGEWETMAARMKEVGVIVDRLTFPLNVAAGVEARGFDPGEPKTVVSEESVAIYHGIVESLRDCFAVWGLDLVRGGRAASRLARKGNAA
jgi:4-hydroxy-tetrahydrodipicolinate synthase